MNERDALKEKLAVLEHIRWSNWMVYLLGKCEIRDGQVVIPAELVAGWQRQINTPYAELSEQEKDSDRKEAEVTIQLLEALRYWPPLAL